MVVKDEYVLGSLGALQRCQGILQQCRETRYYMKQEQWAGGKGVLCSNDYGHECGQDTAGSRWCWSVAGIPWPGMGQRQWKSA